MRTNNPILVFLAALLLAFALATAASAQTAEYAPQLDEELEASTANAVAYVAVEYTKPNSTRRCVESGSGFFVTLNHLVTNHHVVAHALTAAEAQIKVRLFSGTAQASVHPATILKTDPRADLALLSVEGALPPVRPLQIDPDLPRMQTGVFGFGFPLGTMLDRSANGPNVCLRRGYVCRAINDGRNIEADMNIDKGISGGPMVDEQGVVRGVIRAMTGSQFNKSFATISVSSPTLVRFLSGAGCAATLRGGQIMQPDAQVTTMPETEAETTPEPEEPTTEPVETVGFDFVQAFFAVGCALRLRTSLQQ